MLWAEQKMRTTDYGFHFGTGSYVLVKTRYYARDYSCKGSDTGPRVFALR
jgi:hypothetical protein